MASESGNHDEFESPADIWTLDALLSSGKTAWCLEEGITNVMSLMVRIGSGDEVPKIPVELVKEGTYFVSKCYVKNPAERWTAHMLFDHPFLAIDDDGSSSGSLRCGDEDEALVSVSLRDPFDLPDWNSVQSPVNDLVMVCSPINYSPYTYLVRSPEERRVLVTENAPDWSVSCDWVSVR